MGNAAVGTKSSILDKYDGLNGLGVGWGAECQGIWNRILGISNEKETLRINFQSSDHLELAVKQLWRAPSCFSERDEFNIIAMKKMVYR